MSASDVIRIPQHGHCWICGKAMAYGEKTCSADCKAKFDENNKKRRNMMWLMYGSMALAVGILLWNATRGF